MSHILQHLFVQGLDIWYLCRDAYLHVNVNEEIWQIDSLVNLVSILFLLLLNLSSTPALRLCCIISLAGTIAVVAIVIAHSKMMLDLTGTHGCSKGVKKNSLEIAVFNQEEF